AGGGAGNLLIPIGEASLAAKEKSATSVVDEIDPIAETHVPEPPIQTPDPIRPASPVPVLDSPTLTKGPTVTAADPINSAKAQAPPATTGPQLQEHAVPDPVRQPMLNAGPSAPPTAAPRTAPSPGASQPAGTAKIADA